MFDLMDCKKESLPGHSPLLRSDSDTKCPRLKRAAVDAGSILFDVISTDGYLVDAAAVVSAFHCHVWKRMGDGGIMQELHANILLLMVIVCFDLSTDTPAHRLNSHLPQRR